jgi:hypothetical protein
MFYVIGTEDVYIRSTRNNNITRPKTSKKFKLWLDQGKDQALEEKTRALYS